MESKMAACGRLHELRACQQKTLARQSGGMSLLMPQNLYEQIACKVRACMAIEIESIDLVNDALKTARGQK